MEESANKMIVQSYKSVAMQTPNTIYGQRTLLRIVEALQDEIEGKTLDKKYIIETNLWGDKRITMPINKVMAEEETNYQRVKIALNSLMNRTIKIERDNKYILAHLIERVSYDKGKGSIELKLDAEVVTEIMDFSKGWKRYELETALKLKSAYAVKIYQILSNQKTPINYTIEELKIILDIENKYNKTNDFIKRVIEPTKAELDEKSPYTFEYELLKNEWDNGITGKITAIKFVPIYQPNKEDKTLKSKEDFARINAKYPTITAIPKHTEQLLINKIGLTRPGIENNKELFLLACKYFEDFDTFILQITPKATREKRPQGYFINAVKNKLKEDYKVNF